MSYAADDILTDIESGAAQLLSTAFPDGLSNPYSSAQSGSEHVEPYTNKTNPNPYTGNPDANPYTNRPPEGATRSNRDVYAFPGFRDTGSPGAPQLDTSQMLASNGPIPANDSGSGMVNLPNSPDRTQIGTSEVDGAPVVVFRATVDGVQYIEYYNDTLRIYQREPLSPTTLPSPGPSQAPQNLQPQPGSAAQPPVPPAIPQPAQAPASPEATQLSQLSTPSIPPFTPAVPDRSTQTEWVFTTTKYSPIPMVQSLDTGNRVANFALNKVLVPWRNLLAAIENTPFEMMGAVDDALKHSPAQMEYQAAQDMLPFQGAMGLTMEVGPALGYVRSWLSTNQQLRSIATAPAFWFVGAGGLGGGIPQRAPAAMMETVSALPRAGLETGLGEQALQSLGPELEHSLPPTAEQAATAFQDIIRRAEAFLRANPDLVMQLGGSSKGAPISPSQLGAAIGQYAEGNPAFARALSGNALEAIVNAIIEDTPAGAGSFLQVSGPNRIDFIGTGAFEGFTFELTTEAGVADHALRAYMKAPGAMIFTYVPIIE